MPQHRFSFTRLLVPSLLLALLPVTLTGQVREVVSNQLAISQSEAALLLEFADDGVLEISLRDGVVTVDDEAVGSYDRGDALDTAWRALLGEVVNLSDGPLGQALREWDPPSSLSGDAGDAARILDESLEQALIPRASGQVDPEAEIDLDLSADLGLSLRALLSRTNILGELGQALEAIDMLTSAIYIGEDVVVAEDETIEGTILVVDGELTVNGTIEDDVVIVEGSITVNEGGDVLGDVRLVDSRYFGVDESSLGGRVIRIDSDDADVEPSVDLDDRADLENRIRSEVRSELRNELRDEFRDRGRGFSPFRTVGRGVAEVIGDLISFLILSLVALGVVYFAKDNLEVVADTARRNPMRAGLVGIAGAFLVLPTWLLGCVALVVSVVGIIALPFWLILFPIAVALGAGLGFLAIAKNIGEWVAARDINGLEWLQPTNTFYAVVAGVGTILAFSVASNVLDIVPFLGFFSALVATLGSMIATASLLIGFGAVLLTRGGRQAEFYGGGDPFDDEPVWEKSGFADEVSEAEEVDMEPEAEAETEDMAEATADLNDESPDQGGESGDADDD